VNSDLNADLEQSLAGLGFRKVADTRKIADATLLLKRQTWNTNRAVVVVSLSRPPDDVATYLKDLRKRVAFQCGFFPFFWGIGIQAVVVAPGISQDGIDPSKHVDKVDNQWAIIQSVFLADPANRSLRCARTWGQFITGKFQDAITNSLVKHFKLTTPGAQS